ncbi:hypothetical protein KBC79_00895 [Candidatus Woesebacteria bacterium]|nr:hypothetical protein [Candidatus Woesebacteria bacterium]
MEMKYKRHADEINQMAELDQKLRSSEDADWDEASKVDAEHSQRLKAIVQEVGFPTISKVGEKANRNAWLLIQHSPDHDFMKEYLGMMEEQEENEYSSQHHAYLIDRILLHDKKPQMYGTQMVMSEKTGKFELWEVEDRVGLDERRKKIGLEPISEYLKNFE